MRNRHIPKVAIVDYGMGNLYSIERVCESVGLSAHITSSSSEVQSADAVILPGVGAFGDAMVTLRQTGLIDALYSVVASRKPLFGICLGLQLLMTESFEFGHHKGLGLIPGSVVQFKGPVYLNELLRVPHIGWNKIWKTPGPKGQNRLDNWTGTLLEGFSNGEYMYFVHSYYVIPKDTGVILSTTCYGNAEFCSSLSSDNVFACQFHPERSGPRGIRIYENFAKRIYSAL